MRLRKETGDFSIVVTNTFVARGDENAPVVTYSKLPKNLTEEDLFGYVVETYTYYKASNERELTSISMVFVSGGGSANSDKIAIMLSPMGQPVYYSKSTGEITNTPN